MTPCLAVARRLRDARVGAMLVADHGDYVGIVSEADLVRKAMAIGADAEQVMARSVMSTPVMTIDIAQSAHEASDVMAERGIRHLVITEEGRVVGMISVRDLLRYFKIGERSNMACLDSEQHWFASSLSVVLC